MDRSAQEQIAPPGAEAEMTPQADRGETSYGGSERLTGRVAVITGGDSGIAARWPWPMPARAPTCWSPT